MSADDLTWLHETVNILFAHPTFIFEWKMPYAIMLESYYWGNLDVKDANVSFNGGG